MDKPWTLDDLNKLFAQLQPAEQYNLDAWLYMLWAEAEWKAENRNPLEELLG